VGEVAGREPAALREVRQELKVGVADLAGTVRVAAAQPANGRERSLERGAELGDRVVARARAASGRAHATASASACDSSAAERGSASTRAARSARMRTMQGTIAAAVSAT